MLKVSCLGIFLPHVTSQLHTAICASWNSPFPLFPRPPFSPPHPFPIKIQLYIDLLAICLTPFTSMHKPMPVHTQTPFISPLLPTTPFHSFPSSNPFPFPRLFITSLLICNQSHITSLQYIHINPIIPSCKHLINPIYQAVSHLSPNAMKPVLKFSINNHVNIKFLPTASPLDNVPVVRCDNAAQHQTFIFNSLARITLRTACFSVHELCIPSTRYIYVSVCMILTVTDISLNSIKWLVFVMHTLHVYWKVGTKFLYINR